ncbi:VWA domain-containing protein [Stutzerimonas azotifigens]|uniref:VWA domain-containing protein n=1 Tax=Stutzerimonas azotifigens TaxID=291995 RepID=A0ABR5Z367_9GAMM|nr:VWA domain-containing protein [Stutzerimonas azotifigens]MBA1274592.1 VWA domain-containing protein [Stutzerimonas azotifigens]
MSDLLPHLLRPGWLLILPLLGWVLWRLCLRQRRVGRWQRLLPERFHAPLLTQGRLHDSRLPWVLLGAAWLLAVLALLGPSWQLLEQPTLKRADPLVVLLEVSPEMLATDVPPSRLEQAKRKLLDLLEARRGTQTAVVVFAGSAHTLVPLSDDLATTRNLLGALQPSLMPESGHRADLAVERGLELLEQGAQSQGRLLLIGSRLDASERMAIAARLDGKDTRLAVLGVGTEEGAPIAQDDGSFLKDAQGSILVPRLDNHGLRQFATSLGGRYQQARIDDADLAALGLLEMGGSLERQIENTRLSAWSDQGYWLLLPLLLLVALGGRRGWLFCLPLILFNPAPAQAFEWSDLWLRPDQQGQRLLEQQRPAEAAQRFSDPRRQALAHYLAGDYASAIERFALGDSAADHYNRGNALARSDALEAAIEAYDQALERQPDLPQAQQNKALVEELLRQHKAQQAAQKQQSDQADETDSEPEKAAQNAPAPSGGSQDSAAPSLEAGQPGDPAQPSDATPEQKAGADARDQAGSSNATSAEDVPGNAETRQATEQWLRQIPDDPGELLRRKFLYEQRMRQGTRP